MKRGISDSGIEAAVNAFQHSHFKSKHLRSHFFEESDGRSKAKRTMTVRKGHMNNLEMFDIDHTGMTKEDEKKLRDMDIRNA